MSGFLDLARPCTAEDRRSCYRLLLLREPESEAVVAPPSGSTLLDCVRGFAGSAEFEAVVLLPAAAARLDRARLLVPAPDALREWCGAVFGAGGSDPSLAVLLGHAVATLAAGGALDRPPQPFLYAARALARLGNDDASAPPAHAPNPLLREALAARFVAAHDLVEADAHGAALALLDAAAGLAPGGGVADPPLREALHAAFGGVEDWTASALAEDATLIGRSGLFEAGWYAARHPQVAATGLAPLFHYLIQGAAAGLAPSALFSTEHYLDQLSEPPEAGANLLLHYLRTGWVEGLSPHPQFDGDWYRRRHLADQPHVEPLGHYLRVGQVRQLDPAPLFDRAFYLDHYPDLRGSGIDPFVHWMQHGQAEGRVATDPAVLGRSLSIAVVAHVSDPALWPELLNRLRAIPQAFELYATIPDGSPVAARIAEDWPAARVLPVPDTLGEAGAFLRALPLVLERGSDVLLKLHTGRAAVEPDAWRFLMLEGLLGNPSFVRQVLGWFERDPDLVLAGPGAFYLDGPRFGGTSGPVLATLLQEPPAHWGFFAGAMFWARPELLRPLLGIGEAELGADDAERLYGLLAARSGGRIGVSDVSGAKVGPTLAVAPVPHRTVQTHPAETLPARARALAARVPTLRRPTRRTWVAPRGTAPGVTFVGPVEAVSGLGASARGFVDALATTGYPLHVIPWRPGFDRVRLRPFAGPSAGEQAINLVHLNLDLLHSARLLDQPPLDRLLSPDRYNVAIVSWELLALDPRWTETIHRFDEIWASSHYMVRAIEAVSAFPVRVVRPALASGGELPRELLPLALPNDRTVFFYAADFGSVVRRKNPEAFWRAFAEEFTPADGALCLLKLHYPDPHNLLVQEVAALATTRPDVVLLTDSLSDGEMAALFDRVDCYVSPHRAEGLGLTMLEAMRAGKPVIATGFSGEADFVSEDTAFLLDHGLVEVGPGAEPYPAGAVWADPSLPSLRARMREVLADPVAARERGVRGRARFEALFSREQAGAAIGRELERIWTLGGGDRDAFARS